MALASQTASQPDTRLNDLNVRSQAIADVFAAVTEKLPRARVDAQFKRLWPRRLGSPGAQDAQDLMALLLETLAFARDPKGRTAFDRLARQNAFAEGTIEAAALSRICSAHFRALDVVEARFGAAVRVHDPLGDADALLEPCAAVQGERVAGRFAMLADGTLAAISGIVRINGTAAHIAADQIAQGRDGKFRNPERAAEAIYAGVIAAAVETGTPLGDMFVDMLAAADGRDGDRPDYGPNVSYRDGRWHLASDAPDFLRALLDLAETWTRLDSPQPTRADPEGARWLRQEVHPDDTYTLAALGDHVAADSAPARALEAMLAVALDTVEQRAALELGPSMAQFEAELAEPGEGLTATAWQRLQRMRARDGRAGAAQDPALARVIQRIQALKAKTRAAGCTEAEAIAAAEKAEELLRRYDVQLTPEQIAQTDCNSALIATPRKRQDALDTSMGAVARFCGCRHWLQQEADDRLTHVLFGLPADVAAAETLFHVIADTFEAETARFKQGETYAATPQGSRAQATKSFRFGLAHGIGARLHELQTERAQQTRSERGGDLVPVKDAAIDAALDRLGLAFQNTRRRRRALDPQAYHQGVASGRAFQPECGVADAAGTSALGVSNPSG